jgi:hypothetical protein
MVTFDRSLAEIARAQFGLITREQAAAAGIDAAELRRQVRDGMLVSRGRRVFGSPFTPETPMVALAALMLDVGGKVWATGPTAAALLGWDGFTLRPPFHLLMERGRFVERPGHVIHTSAFMNNIDRRTVMGLPTTAGARTLIELARLASISTVDLTTALDSAVRDWHTNEDHLHRRIAALRGHGRHGIRRLIAVIEGHELSRGGHSWLEREFLRLIGEAGLPRPETQVVLARSGRSLVRVDARFPGSPVVAEVLGYRWHRTPAQMSRDADRLNALVAQGLDPYQFTYEHVTSRPMVVVTTLREALDRAARAFASADVLPRQLPLTQTRGPQPA